MTLPSAPRVLRPTRWLVAIVATFAVFTVAGLVTGYRDEGLSISTAAYGVLAIVGCLGVIGVLRTRIILGTDYLEVLNLWSRTRYSRADIARAKFEWGSGVFLQLEKGGWVRLPELGRNAQGVSNTLRAW